MGHKTKLKTMLLREGMVGREGIDRNRRETERGNDGGGLVRRRAHTKVNKEKIF